MKSRPAVLALMAAALSILEKWAPLSTVMLSAISTESGPQTVSRRTVMAARAETQPKASANTNMAANLITMHLTEMDN